MVENSSEFDSQDRLYKAPATKDFRDKVVDAEIPGVTRRTLAIAAGTAIAVGLLAKLGVGRKSESPSQTTEAQSSPEVITNTVREIRRTDDGELTFSSVAEYEKATFENVSKTEENPDGKVVIRQQDPSNPNATFIKAEDVDADGVFRYASKKYNQSEKNSFIVTNPDGSETTFYEWFVLGKKDPETDEKYFVDPDGHRSEIPFFVSPNFVSVISEDPQK